MCCSECGRLCDYRESLLCCDCESKFDKMDKEDMTIAILKETVGYLPEKLRARVLRRIRK